MKAAVVVFPGSNCDHDTLYALDRFGFEASPVWHDHRSLPDCGLVVLPGGFAHGDYLRTGAIARYSPIMESVREFARTGGFVLGICNGFQILQEAGLLPGAMLRNRGLKFVCRHVDVRVERNDTPFTRAYRRGQVLSIPIAHNEGNFYAAPAELERLERRGQVLLRYGTPEGDVTDEANPNGSLHSIAAVTNGPGNVLGMMPHPERACEPCLGSDDGKGILESLAASIRERAEVAQ